MYSQPGATVNTQTSYSIRVPNGITSIAGIAIAAGGGGGGCSSGASAGAGGGGGGALSYTNSIAVTSGETLTVLVPNQSGAGTSAGGNGSAGLAAQLLRSATVLLSAAGGLGSLGRTSTTASAGALGGAAASGVGTVRNSGGQGGAGRADNDTGGGGGGAAGYSGTGGTGGLGPGGGAAGSGGGGGGGAGSNTNATIGGSGGGTLWYGVGNSGAGGTTSTTQSIKDGDLGSSLGGSETILNTPTLTGGTAAVSENNVGMPGGAGPGAPSGGATAFSGTRGAGGAVRLLWGRTSYDFGTVQNTAYNQIYIRGYTNSSTNTILMPTVELGDTVMIFDYANNTSGAPTAVTPSGFTLRFNGTTGTRRLTTYTKQILSSAESGTSLTCANGTNSNAKIAVVISGTSGASYSPRGTTTTGNGQIGSATAFNYSYSESSMDGFATGTTAGFLFFNSTANINPDVDMIYANAITIPGANALTYLKVLPYLQSTTSASASISTLNVGTNTSYFWTTKFF